MSFCRVSDPYQGIHLIRIQRFRLNTNPDPDPIQIQGFDGQKLEKKVNSWKSKTTIYLSLGLHKGLPSYRSLQLSKENIQHFKTWNFLIFFNAFILIMSACILLWYCIPAWCEGNLVVNCTVPRELIYVNVVQMCWERAGHEAGRRGRGGQRSA